MCKLGLLVFFVLTVDSQNENNTWEIVEQIFSLASYFFHTGSYFFRPDWVISIYRGAKHIWITWSSLFGDGLLARIIGTIYFILDIRRSLAYLIVFLIAILLDLICIFISILFYLGGALIYLIGMLAWIINEITVVLFSIFNIIIKE
ncbi:hypothetical protein [Gloeocapsa sp. PCC 73106]|uniref:hypothetical protein n=1 Tax=Gloeocapsa sp. PCC 73106 TaxID=102232 RepID=UPI0002ACC1B5|nr:hypothetical protein [Gloeocapsa sp. PCC 73106]ELR98521.1 hypothetical protein GLO73106DRAFT_00023540 [Gloeocapsa sp. PCC 73106]